MNAKTGDNKKERNAEVPPTKRRNEVGKKRDVLRSRHNTDRVEGITSVMPPYMEKSNCDDRYTAKRVYGIKPKLILSM